MREVLIFGVAVTIAAATFASASEPANEIGITADVPVVTVIPRRPGRINLRLPSLTYALTVRIDCAGDWQPDSVSISVADSRTSLVAEQLRAGKELKLELTIPSNQIAPLRIEQFCVSGDKGKPDMANQNRITVPGVMTAQASIRCALESTQAIKYATVPLDVMLECSPKEAAAD